MRKPVPEVLVRIYLFALFLSISPEGLGLPVNRGQVKEKHQQPPSNLPGMEMEEYERYWDELIRNDPEFHDRLSKIKDVDLNKLKELIAKNPHLQERLLQGAPDVRNRVDEARRVNIEQIRQLQKLQNMRDNNLMKDGDWMTKMEAARDNLPEHFTKKDIRTKIEEAHRNLEKLDEKRREDFKQQEMWMEHQRRQKLAQMNEQQRLKAEEEYRRKHEDLKHHEKLPQPGSKEQLEQVWEEDDGMPKEEFDPRTFFHMHDTNADSVLDPMEIEALFLSELKKVYKDEKDMAGPEAHEDLARMREYTVSEMDKDKDGLISLDEFMRYASGKDFEKKEEYHPIVDEDAPFSDKEFKDYEDAYEEDYDYQYDKDGNIIGVVPREHKQDKDHQQPPHVNEQGHPLPGGDQQGHPDNQQGLPGGDQQGHPDNQQGHPLPGGNQQGHPNNQPGHPLPGGDQQGHPAPGGNEQGHPPPHNVNENAKGELGGQPVIQIDDPHSLNLNHPQDQRKADMPSSNRPEVPSAPPSN